MVVFRRSIAARCTVASLCSLRRWVSASRVGCAELRHIRRDARQGALVLARVVVPTVDQGSDAVLVGVDAYRLFRPAAPADQPLEVAQPFQFGHQRPQLGIALAELRHAGDHGVRAIEIVRGHLGQPGRHVGLEGGFGGKRLELHIVRALLQLPVRQHGGLCVVALRDQLLELAIGRAPPIQGHSHQRPARPPAPRPTRRRASRPLHRGPGRPTRAPTTAPPRARATRSRRRLIGDGGHRRRVAVGAFVQRVLDAEDLEERGRSRHESGLAVRGGTAVGRARLAAGPARAMSAGRAGAARAGSRGLGGSSSAACVVPTR